MIMVLICASLVVDGDMSYSDVPNSIKTMVGEKLRILGCEHLIEGAE